MLSDEDRVVVYMRDGCTVCARVKDFLTDHDVDYETREVDLDPLTPMELWELFNRKANRLRVPFTALNDGEDVVLGFDPMRLEAVFVHDHRGGTSPTSAVEGTETYDEFTTDELRDDRWAIARLRDASGQAHDCADANAEVTTGDGSLEVTIKPFSRFDDNSQILNNPKQLYVSTERIATPSRGAVRFEVDMAVTTYAQIPHDLRDAFGTVNLLDFTTGMVLDFAATNDVVYVVYERLLMPGVTTEEESFTHRVVLEVDAAPGLEHHYAIEYERDTAEARWFVDGDLVYWANTPVPVEGFNLGMGLFSSRDIERYTRDEREHGQGATGRWGPCRITADGSAA